jgi:ornithine--oxo-acid transaminase
VSKKAGRAFSTIKVKRSSFSSSAQPAMSARTQKYIDLDSKYVAHYYQMAPVVIERGERIYLYDVDGKRYYDMLAGFGAVSQGHCHPKIRQAMIDQSEKLTLCSRSLN